jgi:hypothetical protein
MSDRLAQASDPSRFVMCLAEKVLSDSESLPPSHKLSPIRQQHDPASLVIPPPIGIIDESTTLIGVETFPHFL